MKTAERNVMTVVIAVASFGLALTAGVVTASVLPPVFAHCDTLSGPVTQDARAALDRGDATPVLKWVRKGDEPAIREAFQRTVAVRKLSPEAKDLADMYFFETLVRIHRAGEGAPYTGLKAGAPEPIVAAADKAIETGSVKEFTDEVTKAVAGGIHDRFARVMDARKGMNDSVDAGREYVEAYVTYVHYVEGIHAAATASPHASETGSLHGEGGEAPAHDE